MGKLYYYALSETGRREHNEDAFSILEIDSNIYFFAVADGMGGKEGGEIASQLVLKAAEDYLKSGLLNLNEPVKLKKVIKDIYHAGHDAIAHHINLNPGHSGMGTTLACVLIYGKHYVIGNLGDSRVYMWKNNNFSQISEDHTYIQKYLKENQGKADPQILAQYSHLLLKSLDGKHDHPDIFPIEQDYDTLNEGNAFLLCSDGLITNKSEQDTRIFTHYLFSGKDLPSSAKALVDHALKDGSSDNMTVILAYYGHLARLKKPITDFIQKARSDYRQKKNRGRIYIVLTLILIIMLTLIVFYVIPQQKNYISAELKDTSVIDTPVTSLDKPDIKVPNIIDFAGFLSKLPIQSIDNELSWIGATLENDSVDYYTVFFSEAGDKSVIDSIRTETTTCIPASLKRIKPKIEYYVRVRVTTKSGLKKFGDKHLNVKFQQR